MSEILIVAGSITNATRLEKRLLAYGDRVTRVVNTPAEISKGGCSYSVVASLKSEGFVRSNIKGIRIYGIFLIDTFSGKRYYHDIS